MSSLQDIEYSDEQISMFDLYKQIDKMPPVEIDDISSHDEETFKKNARNNAFNPLNCILFIGRKLRYTCEIITCSIIVLPIVIPVYIVCNSFFYEDGLWRYGEKGRERGVWRAENKRQYLINSKLPPMKNYTQIYQEKYHSHEI